MKQNIYLLMLMITIITFGCADLDEPQPINSIATENAIVDKASATAAMNGVYSDLQDGTLAFDGWLGLAQLFSDESVFTGTFPTRLEFGNKNVFPANTTMAAVFSDLYEVINRANNVIALVPNVVDDAFDDASRNSFVAQARFLRAQCYLHLTTLWQDVPLILDPTIDVGEVLQVPKASSSAIYDQVISDFEFAKANLTTAGPNLASAQAATAFLARIALYQGNYGQALTLAQEALAGADITTVGYLADQIYSLSFSATDGNSLAFFYGPAELGGRHSIEPSAKLINAYEDGDLRFAASIVNDTLVATVPFGIKYPSFSEANAGAATDPIFFIRHSEMVLIAAEASAEAGDFTAASMYINMVRTRAGLADITLDANNYVDAILQERFVELAMEGPHRLLDLRRKGKAIDAMGGEGYEACDAIWPLPQREVDRNTNLDQNTCCNC